MDQHPISCTSLLEDLNIRSGVESPFMLKTQESIIPLNLNPFRGIRNAAADLQLDAENLKEKRETFQIEVCFFQ